MKAKLIPQDKISIAPMIDWTNSHFRILMRILAPNAYLYTEMQTIGAILHNPNRALAFDEIEQPIVLQLGGSNPKQLAKSAELAQSRGFTEVNLNLGCPSDRVQAGCFGAVLMKNPTLVASCIRQIKDTVSIPVTAKVRIGVDELDDYSHFAGFVDSLVDAGTDKLIVHARKAWLKGLSPKQNRTIPPLHYDFAYKIKECFPEIPVIINGNITGYEQINQHLQYVDGVMLGRLACNNPYEIAVIHQKLFPECPLPSRACVLQNYFKVIQDTKVPLSILFKPIFNLAHGMANAKIWKGELMNIINYPQTFSEGLLEDMLFSLEDKKIKCA